MMEALTDISLERFPTVAEELGLKPYAADQIIAWLYRDRVVSFDEMTNLSQKARRELARRFLIDVLQVETIQEAEDGTRKFLLRARDAAKIESVLIPMESGRLTACISSQVGCAMACSFCRTAAMGFGRHLTLGEIVGQLRLIMRQSERQLTNVVFMGMGEPLHNFETVVSAAQMITSPKAFGLSKRHVTLSTSGLIPQLDAFSRRVDIKLAISLNATTDEVRNQIMPVNRRFPLADIMAFARDYTKRSRHRITFEYVMIAGVNDHPADAHRLLRLLRGIRAKVNLIPFNPFSTSDYKRPSDEVVLWWRDTLQGGGIQANIRVSRGRDILGACGQLATLRSHEVDSRSFPPGGDPVSPP